KIVSTEKGRKLIAQIPAMVADPVTTAKWELALAGIEAGKLTMADFMAYQEDLIQQLVDQAKADAAKRPRPTRPAASDQPKNSAKHKAGDTCPDCGGTLQEKALKKAPEKKYLGCSKYPECKHFEWLQ
ncbi:MAG: DNA topoisomerase III, partial [Neisseria sp.]